MELNPRETARTRLRRLVSVRDAFSQMPLYRPLSVLMTQDIDHLLRLYGV